MNAADRQRIYVQGLEAKVYLLEQSVATQKHVLGERDAEIARHRAALQQIKDEAHEHGIAWTQRTAQTALEGA